MKDFNVEGVERVAVGGVVGEKKGSACVYWGGGGDMSQVSLPAPGTVLSPLPALLGVERQEKREK